MRASKKVDLILFCASTEIRTPVLALKGLRPSPLDDGGNRRTNFTISQFQGQVFNGMDVEKWQTMI